MHSLAALLLLGAAKAATLVPSAAPSLSFRPTTLPTSGNSSRAPTPAPTLAPTWNPSSAPTVPPVPSPTRVPLPMPSPVPSLKPTSAPSVHPTAPSPSPTSSPSFAPSFSPSVTPSLRPTLVPTNPTPPPTGQPTLPPTPLPSELPSMHPTQLPTALPTWLPSAAPTTLPTDLPTGLPTWIPSPAPSTTPTQLPTALPTLLPSAAPTSLPTNLPTGLPTWIPSPAPSPLPSALPTALPSLLPSAAPTPLPSMTPTSAPTGTPRPSPLPSSSPTPLPSTLPSSSPSPLPSSDPSASPTPVPSLLPSPSPTSNPTPLPTDAPTPETWVPTPVPSLGCALGFYFDETAGSCELCPAGTYSDETQAPFVCHRCPHGYYQPGLGATTCSKCPDGAVVSGARSQCTFCDPGYYAHNSTTCIACPVSTYAPAPETEACLDCPPGFSTGVASGATDCSICAAGTKTSGSGYGCIICPIGRFSESGASTCTTCEAGKYANVTGSSACVKCPGSLYSLPASTTCELCRRDYYLDPFGECQACPTGSVCKYDGENTYTELEIAKGYWRISETSVDVLECPLAEACNGQGTAALEANSSQRRLGSFSNDYCTPGYKGTLCSVCDTKNDYFKSFDTGKCEACADVNSFGNLLANSPTFLTFILVLLGIVIATVAVTVLERLRHPNDRERTDRESEEDASDDKPLKDSHHAPRTRLQLGVELKQMISFAQIVATMRYTCGVTFPAHFDALLAILAIFNLDVYPALGMQCQVKYFDFINRMVCVTGGPLLFGMFMAAMHSFTTGRRHHGHTFYYGFWLLSFLSIVSASTVLVEFWQCREFYVPHTESNDGDDNDDNGTTESYLIADLGINCDGERYAQYSIYVVLMIFVYPVGLPLLYASSIWEYRKGLRSAAVMERQASLNYPNVGHILFLFEGYSSRFYWYELVDCARRLGLTAALSIVSHMESVLSPTVGLVLSLLSVHVAEWRPFKESGDNSIGVVNQYLLVVLFLAAILLQTESVEEFAEENHFGLILVFVFCLSPLVAVAKMGSKFFCTRNDESTDEMLYDARIRTAETLGSPSNSSVASEQSIELVNMNPRHHDNARSSSAPTTTLVDRLARRAQRTVNSSISVNDLETVNFLEPDDVQLCSPAPQPSGRRALRARSRDASPRQRPKPRTSIDPAADHSAIEMMARMAGEALSSTTAAPASPAAPPSGGSLRTSRMRERKAALLKEEEARAKSRTNPYSLGPGLESAAIGSPVSPQSNHPETDSSQAPPDAVALRKAKYKAKLAQRKAQEDAAGVNGNSEKSKAGGLLNAASASDAPGIDGGSAPRPSPLVARMQQRRQRSNLNLGQNPDTEGASIMRQPAPGALNLANELSLDGLSGDANMTI